MSLDIFQDLGKLPVPLSYRQKCWICTSVSWTFSQKFFMYLKEPFLFSIVLLL